MAKMQRRDAPPVFTGVTPARLKSWTLIVPLVLAIITTIGACNPDSRDRVIERVLNPDETIQ